MEHRHEREALKAEADRGAERLALLDETRNQDHTGPQQEDIGAPAGREDPIRHAAPVH